MKRRVFNVLVAVGAKLVVASPAPYGHGHDHDELGTQDGDNHGEQVPIGYVSFPQQFSNARFFRSGGGMEQAHRAWIPGDGEVTADAIFSGIATFAHLPFANCLSDPSADFDIAFLGAPFDTGTSYRPGARFGPSGIRQGSRRLTLYGGYNVPLEVNPFRDWAKVVDCGDVPVTPYDNVFAIKQIEQGHKELLHRKASTVTSVLEHGEMRAVEGLGRTGKVHPRVITLGGDHTIVLPLLRSINSAYGPVSVIHFDSHLDTWKPTVFGGAKTDTASINHGTYFYHASQEGLIKNGSSVHAGIRTTLSGPSDYANDKDCGFVLSEAREIDTIGTQGIIDKIRNTVGDNLVYLSLDIDVLDPSAAPATGTPETGGWSTRELRTILRGLEGLNIISADVVEVATPSVHIYNGGRNGGALDAESTPVPRYDSQAELTVQAAADVLYEIMSLMVKKGPLIKE